MPGRPPPRVAPWVAIWEAPTPITPPARLQIGLEKAFDTTSPAEQKQLVELLVALAGRGVLSADDLKEGTQALLEQLGDIRWGPTSK